MRPMLGADLDTDAFCESLKTHEKVWAAAGSHYGRDGEGFVRINIATQRALLLEGLTRLAAGAERWQNREKNERAFSLVRRTGFNVRYYR